MIRREGPASGVVGKDLHKDCYWLFNLGFGPDSVFIFVFLFFLYI